ncbi:MAG: hypothetical protein LAO23_19645 [Acidobacteriia bacterium]|nr:hypothetical protein [Terriglobia bacterium]
MRTQIKAALVLLAALVASSSAAALDVYPGGKVRPEALAQLNAPREGIGWRHVLMPPNAAAGGAVTLDQIQSASQTFTGVTSFSFNNQTITAGLTNPALVVFLAQTNNTVVTGLTVTWDSGGTNQAMTQLAHLQLGIADGYLFGLLNPTAGNKTLAASWTTASQFIVGSMSVSHASAFQNPTTNNGTSALETVTIASQANDMVATVFASTQNQTGGFNGTQVFLNNGGNIWTCAGSRNPGAASVTATANISVSAAWLAVAIDIVHD